eukprot:COSAG02_NODE_8798_length_2440_cov_4.297736_3_plen_51_part_00
MSTPYMKRIVSRPLTASQRQRLAFCLIFADDEQVLPVNVVHYEADVSISV